MVRDLKIKNVFWVKFAEIKKINIQTSNESLPKGALTHCCGSEL